MLYIDARFSFVLSRVNEGKQEEHIRRNGWETSCIWLHCAQFLYQQRLHIAWSDRRTSPWRDGLELIGGFEIVSSR